MWREKDREKWRERKREKKCPSDLMVICFCQKSLSDRLFQTWFAWLFSSSVLFGSVPSFSVLFPHFPPDRSYAILHSRFSSPIHLSVWVVCPICSSSLSFIQSLFHTQCIQLGLFSWNWRHRGRNIFFAHHPRLGRNETAMISDLFGNWYYLITLSTSIPSGFEISNQGEWEEFWYLFQNLD